MGSQSTKLQDLSAEQRAVLAMRLRKQRAEQASTESEFPEIVADSLNRNEPFPLTDLQQAYWLGRTITFEIGSIPSKAYIELKCEKFDLARFEQAWNRLVQAHEMLRMIVNSEGQQQILAEVPYYSINETDLRGQSTESQRSFIDEVYDAYLYDDRTADQWPLFQLSATRQSDESTVLHICLDLLNFDAGSIALVFREVSRLYQSPDEPISVPELSFRDYAIAEKRASESSTMQKARAYWESRLGTIPPAPELPLACNPITIEKPRFRRHQSLIEQPTWQQLRAKLTDIGLTPTGLLLAVYAEVLNKWSNNSHFCINIPVFNRLPVHPQINDIVGDFTTVNLLEVNNTEAEPFERRAKRLQEQLMNDLDHRQMNGVQVLRELARLDRATFAKGIPVIFTSLLGHGFTDSLHAMGQISRSINQTAQVWMDLHVDESSEGLVIKWDAVEGLFPEYMVTDMLDAYCNLLRQLANGNDAWQTSYHDLLPERQRALRTELNNTTAPMPDGLLHTHFAERVAENPQHPAVITPKRTFTYQELLSAANRVGHCLRTNGAKPNQLVAICMDKGWEQVVAAYGTLIAGAAYVPIDPEFPPERVLQLLERSNVQLILTQSWLQDSLSWPDNVRCFSVDDDALWGNYPDTSLDPVQTPDDLAYMLYTSGSTGLPKGVMLAHRGSVNRMFDVVKRFGLTASDICIGLTALQHDLSIFDIFWMLGGAGGTVAIPDSDLRRDPSHWADFMIEHQITAWNSVPAFMEMFVEYLQHRKRSGKPMPDSLRLAMHSGDWVPVSLPERIQSFMPNAQVISLGGPTETTTWDVNYPIERVEPTWKSIPYGRPMTNASYYVYNDLLEPCPDWVTGEMYIGGVGLAKGYWQDEEQTNARFISHPRTGERLYRSGDTGRLLPDGNIEFMGRADFQVKIRGMRIELGEIEAALEQHAAVRASVVSTYGDPRSKDKQLVAYVVTTSDEDVVADELASYLSAQLPSYMVPTSFVMMEQLPLTRNGKVDRRNLPEPDLSTVALAASNVELGDAAASAGTLNKGQVSDTERRVAKIVAEVLKISELAANVNLMSLGANSIDMVRIGNHLEGEFGFRPGMDQIFRLQTVDAIAGYVAEKTGAGTTDAGAAPGQTGTGMTGMTDEIAAIIHSFDIILEPEDRDTFKATLPNLRHDMDGRPWVALPPVTDPQVLERYKDRRSHRRFSLKAIPFDDFAKLIRELVQLTIDGKAKYLYASAGGVYPLQTYFHVKPGRVEGLDGGIYYYHPVDNRLVQISSAAEIPRDIHVPYVNTPTFDEAAFSIFMISQLSAVAPIYGEYSIHFSTMEAGIMSHVLDSAAPSCGIGLCHIGSIDFDQIRDLFALDDTHILIHSVLGGLIDAGSDSEDKDSASETSDKLQKTARALDRIKQLSPEEIRAMLNSAKNNE